MNDTQCQLWMGNLESYMTENFVMTAFTKMGEDPRAVRMMRSKFTGDFAGYCFVTFASPEHALDVMHKLNGKPIPGTNPVVRFRLNGASNSSHKTASFEREYSIWVGDLSSDVDDYSLYRVFNKYKSIKVAKVVLDSSGFSKGYGFVRFASEEEKNMALQRMNGYVGLGSKPLRLCSAVSKQKAGAGDGQYPASGTAAGSGNSYDYSQYLDASTVYWQAAGNYAQQSMGWQGQGYEQSVAGYAAQYAQQQQQQQQQESEAYVPPQADVAHGQQPVASEQPHLDDGSYALVEHKVPLDVDQLNNECLERDRNLWDALESSKWSPIELLTS